MQQRTDKAFAYAEHARTSLTEAMFQLAVLDPLLRDRQILDPLDKTSAANTLGVLQWTLLGGAAINLYKVVFDRNERSGSLVRLMAMLGDPALVAALRSKRTEQSLNYGKKPSEIDAPTWEAMKKQWQEDDQKKAEATFDMEFPKLRKKFEMLKSDGVGKRLGDVRNKVLAHGDVTFTDGKYRGSEASDFGLLWGDVEAFAVRVVEFVEGVFVVVFGHPLAQSETKAIFEDYSRDFWSYLQGGLLARTNGDPAR